MIDLSVLKSSAIKLHTIFVLIKDREDHAPIKQLMALAVENANLFKGIQDIPFFRDGVQEGAVAAADLKVSEEIVVSDSPGLEIFQRPLILTKSLVIKGDYTIQ
jgi:hypothetical protein